MTIWKRRFYWLCMSVLCFIAIMLVCQIGINIASADCEIIDIKVKEPEYVPIDGDIRPMTNALEDYTEEDVERISRLLWSSPLSTESEKVKLIWLVCNRINSRVSAFSKMKNTETAITTHEFPYYDRKAHLSETNHAIVTETLESYNSWFSGEDIGTHPSAQAVYCSFYGNNNEHIHLYDYLWGDVE